MSLFTANLEINEDFPTQLSPKTHILINKLYWKIGKSYHLFLLVFLLFLQTQTLKSNSGDH